VILENNSFLNTTSGLAGGVIDFNNALADLFILNNTFENSFS
jgi:hypothetical protein